MPAKPGLYGEPDVIYYRDTGCPVSPKCVDCPLPACRYESYVPGQGDIVTAAERAERDARIFELRKKGVPVPEIVRQFHVSPRTVARAMERAGQRAKYSLEINESRWTLLGKPVSEIGNGGFRQRPPWPQLRRAM